MWVVGHEVKEAEDQIMKLRLEVKQSKRSKWFFHFKASNGKIVLVSEEYSSRAKCMQTVKAVAECCVRASRGDFGESI